MRIRPIAPADAQAWAALRAALWPADHRDEVAAYFRGELAEPLEVLFAEEGPEVLGFVELSMRTDFPGLEGARVGFVEGLYVAPAHRHEGVARALLQAARGWTRSRGGAHFGSDRAGRFVLDAGFTARGRTRRP